MTARLVARKVYDSTERVRCGIGHEVAAQVVIATYQHLDMDGEPMTPFAVEEYEPPTCVVCGLRLVGKVPTVEPAKSTPSAS